MESRMEGYELFYASYVDLCEPEAEALDEYIKYIWGQTAVGEGTLRIIYDNLNQHGMSLREFINIVLRPVRPGTTFRNWSYRGDLDVGRVTYEIYDHVAGGLTILADEEKNLTNAVYFWLKGIEV